jgi:hypothetical protein
MDWNGHRWSTPAQPHANSAAALAVTPSGDVWIGDPLQRWDGRSWTWSHPLHWFFAINSIVAISATDLWAVGFHIKRTFLDSAHTQAAHYSCIG